MVDPDGVTFHSPVALTNRSTLALGGKNSPALLGRGTIGSPTLMSREMPMDVRFHLDPDTDLPHIFGHGVTEAEAEYILRHPG